MPKNLAQFYSNRRKKQLEKLKKPRSSHIVHHEKLPPRQRIANLSVEGMYNEVQYYQAGPESYDVNIFIPPDWGFKLDNNPYPGEIYSEVMHSPPGDHELHPPGMDHMVNFRPPYEGPTSWVTKFFASSIPEYAGPYQTIGELGINKWYDISYALCLLGGTVTVSLTDSESENRMIIDTHYVNEISPEYTFTLYTKQFQVPIKGLNTLRFEVGNSPLFDEVGSGFIMDAVNLYKIRKNFRYE